ncbi:hypothetical protein AGMMS49592_3470 [Endomicrobiia bacterium]|nr:hypothetical protein AGMMS49592_3470 [Endomicrobiia bacterium]
MSHALQIAIYKICFELKIMPEMPERFFCAFVLRDFIKFDNRINICVEYLRWISKVVDGKRAIISKG